MTGKVNSSSGWHSYGYGKLSKVSYAWGKADNLYKWIKSNHCLVTHTINKKSKIKNVAEILYKNYKNTRCIAAVLFDWQSDGKVDHAALLGNIIRNKNNYSVYFYAHTGARGGEKIKYHIYKVRNGKRQYYMSKGKKIYYYEDVYVDLSFIFTQYDKPTIYICTLY